MQKLDGYFPLYWDEHAGTLFLEIPRLDTDFLYSTGLAAGLGSNDIGLDRGQGGQGRVVSFQRVGPKVMMVQGNESFRSTSANPAERKSVEDSFAKSILWGFTVAAESSGHLLVDATDFVLRDGHGAGNALRPGPYRVDRTRSAVYMPRTKAFPKNTGTTIANFSGEASVCILHRQHGARALAHEHDQGGVVEQLRAGAADVEAAEGVGGRRREGASRQ